MKLSKRSALIILFGLYAAAILVRGMDAGQSDYLYFNDASATNFRYAQMIAQSGSVPELDRKAAWPDGLPVAQVMPLGLEYVQGYSYRLVKFFSETDERAFSKSFSRLFLSLLVFSIYGLTMNLWRHRGAALLAALLAACFHPLVRLTNGNDLLHFNFALVLICWHLTLLVRARKYDSTPAALLAAVASFGLLAIWESAAVYLSLSLLAFTVWPGGRAGKSRLPLTVQVIVFAATAAMLPHLHATRAAFSWPAAGIYSAALYNHLAGRLPVRARGPWPGVVILAVGTMILAAVLKPLYAGGLGSITPLEYYLYRLRYAFGKPGDPSALPAWARYLWTAGHASPGVWGLLGTLAPFGWFVPGVVLVLRGGRSKRQQHTADDGLESVTEDGSKWPLIWLTGLGLLFYAVDRSMLPLTLLALLPLAAASIVRAGRLIQLRQLLAALAALIIVGQTMVAGGRLEILGPVLGTSSPVTGQTGQFQRISIGEPDRDLLRFLLTRTLVENPILSLPQSSSLLIAFGGRTTALVPGVQAGPMIDKTVTSLRHWYQDEETFYAFCRENGIDYVAYSIDIVLDGSNYSPAYLSGNREMQPAATAYKMHFFPESLKRFQLMYENGVYRLYKVTEVSSPFFTTDHPPVYQYEIIERNNDTLAGFYGRIQQLLLMYTLAGEQLAAGNVNGALLTFNECIGQAPRFTAAVLGRASVLSSIGELREALNTYQYVISYAPDNAEALYGTAFTLARLGDTDQARGFIEVLLSSTADPEMTDKANLLKWFIEQGIPVDRPAALPDSLRRD